jgi:hypothetical protein
MEDKTRCGSDGFAIGCGFCASGKGKGRSGPHTAAYLRDDTCIRSVGGRLRVRLEGPCDYDGIMG